MRLKQAFGIQRGDQIAFIGAGGKTSALFRLGNELSAEGWRVVGTTTTRIPADSLPRAPGVLDVSVGLRPAAISRLLNQHGFVFLYSRVEGDHALGLTPEQSATLADTIDSDVTLVEADIAYGASFKAPSVHEPIIPDGTSLVVPMVGFDAIGQLLDNNLIYNARTIAEEFGFPYGERLRAPWIATVLRDDQFGLRGIPDRARIIPFINKVARTGYPRLRARLMARLMLISPRIEGVALGALTESDSIHEVRRRVGAVILAGGLSSRMGELKVLLPWDGRPIINAIIDKLRRARVEQIVVVTGHRAAEVRGAIREEGVTICHNPDYAQGDMLSSMQVGLRALNPEISAALLCLGDQPQIDVRIAYDVMTAYAEGRGSIIAPSYQMRRGHPYLLDRQYWSEIWSLPKDSSPREVINAHSSAIGYVQAKDDSILRDIDTPEDYARELRLAGLRKE